MGGIPNQKNPTARQFLGQMDKPDVDFIEGLSPAVSIDQKSTNRNPRSTVGTITEVYDYLRLLFSRVGARHCPSCATPMARRSVQEMVDQMLVQWEGQKVALLAPVIRGRKGEYRKELETFHRQGYLRARIDGEWFELEDPPKLARYKRHDIDVVVDRLTLGAEQRTRLTESLEAGETRGRAIEYSAAIEDGSVAVFTGDGEVIEPSFDGGFYAGRVVPDPTGEGFWVLDGNWQNNGGGVYWLPIDCETGEPSAATRVVPATSPCTSTLTSGR